MKNLKSYAAFVRENHLEEFVRESIRVIKTMNIPLLRFFPDLNEDEMYKSAIVSSGDFLQSLEDGTALAKAKESLNSWEQDKLQGISKHDIQPSDIVFIYAAQKKALLKFLPHFTKYVHESMRVVSQLESYYTRVQNDAFKLMFKIQKETEILLGESEKRYHQLVEEVVDYAIFGLDTKGRIISWNKGAENINGYTEGEVLGKNITMFYTKEDKKNNVPRRMLREAKECGRATETVKHVKKDKSIYWADVSINSIVDEKGKLTGYVKITKDITEQLENKKEIAKVTDELRRSNQELEQFAYVASHDLQEPLRMVSSYVQLLANRYKDKLDQDANDFIYYAVDGSNRMRTLINSLLDYSRINRSKPFEWNDMNEVMGDVLTDLSDVIKESKAKIRYEHLPKVYGDNVLIGQLMHNLVSNAIKFRGKRFPEIVISFKKLNGQYCFAVQDNGIGIQPEYAEKIFVIFQRLHSKVEYPGTGIGLAMCKKIVNRHGGKIWVDSKVGEGATFYFTLKGK